MAPLDVVQGDLEPGVPAPCRPQPRDQLKRIGLGPDHPALPIRPARLGHGDAVRFADLEFGLKGRGPPRLVVHEHLSPGGVGAQGEPKRGRVLGRALPVEEHECSAHLVAAVP